MQVIGRQSHLWFNGSCCLYDFQYLGGELFIKAKDSVFCFCVMFIQSLSNLSVCLWPSITQYLWVLQSVGHQPVRCGILFYVDFSLPSHWGFFVFGCGVSFSVGSSVLLLMVVEQLIAILVLSQEEMSASHSTPPSWMGSSLVIVFNWDCILSDISIVTQLCMTSSLYPLQYASCF